MRINGLKKKIIVFLMIFVLLSSTSYCDAISFNTKIGEAYHSSIKVILEGKLVPAYAINEEIYVSVADLGAYGFSIDPEESGKLVVVPDASAIRYTVNDSFKAEDNKKIATVFSSEQKVVMQGVVLDALSMDGITVIPVVSLSSVGKYFYNEKMELIIIDIEFKNSPSEVSAYVMKSDHAEYSGDATEERPSGRGCVVYTSGDQYLGTFLNGLRQGEGVYLYANGDRFSGYWDQDEINGFGVYQFADGEKYAGGWKNNSYSGKGQYDFISGARYIGDWENCKMHGYGIYTYPDGKKVTGNWLNNTYVDGQKRNFTLDSSYEEVIASMGQPDSYDEINQKASYGGAVVYYNSAMRVSGWLDFSSELNVVLLHTREVLYDIGVGVTAQTIVNRYGCPNGIYSSEAKIFYYPAGSVTFDQAWKVKSWSGTLE
jgi:hypothetical protein